MIAADNARAKAGEALLRDCDECPELVVVPAGEFLMGSPDSERGRFSEEGPVHRVTIGEPFAVGVYEVTFEEWDACVRGGGCGGHRPYDERMGSRESAGHQRELEGRPVVRGVVEQEDRQTVPAAQRIGVGVRGAGGDADAVSLRQDDIAGAGELRRNAYVRSGENGSI